MHLSFSMVEQFEPRLARTGSKWFLFIWSEKHFPFFILNRLLKKSQEQACLLNWCTVNIPQGYRRNTLVYNICHWVDIYRLLWNVWLLLANISSKFSFIASLATMTFPHSSSMNTNLGESSKFRMSFISIQSSSSSTITFFSKVLLC